MVILSNVKINNRHEVNSNGAFLDEEKFIQSFNVKSLECLCWVGPFNKPLKARGLGPKAAATELSELQLYLRVNEATTQIRLKAWGRPSPLAANGSQFGATLQGQEAR